jgi:hypothetical protein
MPELLLLKWNSIPMIQTVRQTIRFMPLLLYGLKEKGHITTVSVQH